jgi:RHS repeat-associated protein
MSLFHRVLFGTVITFSILVSQAIAQNSSDRGTPADSKKGQSAQSTYARDKIETVNLANGNFSLSIPLASVGGRGSASFTIALSYNSKVWTTQSDGNGMFTGEGAQGTFRNLYTAMYDKHRTEDDEPYLIRLPGGWSILTSPGIKLLTYGIGHLTSGCNVTTDDQPDCGFKYALTKMWVTLPDGSQLELRDVATQGTPYNTTDPYIEGYFPVIDRDRGQVWRSIDGSNVIFVRDAGYPVGHIGGVNEFPTGWVFLSNGTRMRMEQGVGTKIIDRNGNFITFDRSTATYTDQLGRQTVVSGSGVTVKGYLGVPDRSISLNFGIIGDFANLRSDFHGLHRPFTTGDAFNDALDNFHDHMIPGDHTDLFLRSEGSIAYGTDHGFDVGTATAVTQLNLLDGRSLRFRYNQYGEVSEIVYPGGGVSRVDYGGGVLGNCEIPAPFSVNRVVTSRRTLKDNGSVDATWVYSPDSEWIDGVYRPGVAVSAYQGEANGTLLVSERHLFRALNAEYRPCGLFNGTGNEKWDNAKEFRTEISTGTGTTVTVRDWTQRTPMAWPTNSDYYIHHGQDQAQNDERVNWEETTLEDGKVKRVEYGYDQFNNVTSIREFDFGTTGTPGTLLRQTFRTYLTAQNGYCYSNLNPSDSSCGNGLATDVSTIIYQPGLLLSETIRDSSNDPNPPKARTDFEYDNYTTAANHAAIVSNSAMIQYDGSRFSAFSSGTQPRGNATKVTRWLSGGADVVAFSQYDNAGQVIWSKDPNGNVSTVKYWDSFGAGDNPEPVSTGAGPAGATFALASVATNAAGQVVKMQYNYSLGAASGVKDPNNVITKTEYDDLGRPFKVTTALGLAEQSISVMAYPSDTVNEAKVSKQLDATRWLSSKTSFDGFDRPVLSSSAEDGLYYTSASYTIFSKTVYDPLGRGKLVTNPYRAAAALTDGWNRSTEDLGGRLTEVAKFIGAVASPPPDSGTNSNWGGSVSSVYESEVTTVTDQAGKKRRSVTDGLGRLVRVDEPGANGNLDVNDVPLQSTIYGYDTLDNLITVTQVSVTQGTQTRTFVYDSLKRLTSATNPESGTTCYGTVSSGECQADGYDANGNLIYKTDARGVRTTYAYDVLNRNTSITYSTNAATPTVTRTYDGATNGVGKAWKTETSGASGSRTTIDSYDAMGRPTSQSQQFYSNSAWSDPFTVTATYDLAGHVLMQTYPSGNQVNYTYDDAGRTEGFAGNLGNGSDLTYSSGMIYSASGALAKEEFGTDTPIFNKLLYNARGQLAEIRESTSYTDPDDTSWDRGAIINHYSNGYDCWGAHCNAPDNNGNLMKQEVYIPTDAEGNYAMRWQQYEYDSLNRLSWVREISGENEIWRQSFAYDRFGNRSIDQDVLKTYGSGINKKDFTVNVLNKNRLGVPDGQTGTMSYDDAGNLTTDTYSGAAVIRTYDAENRMTAETQAGSVVAGSYTYDADGRRVRRHLASEESDTWQVYGIGGELLAEYDGADGDPASPQMEYGYRNGQLLIEASGGRRSRGLNLHTPICLACQGNSAVDRSVQWFVTDQLGTPRMIFDKSGLLAGVSRHDYLPFGEELFDGTGGRTTQLGYSAADGVRQKFTDKERDNETGLDYFGERFYGSTMGRFTTADPMMSSATTSNPQSLNRYTFVLNNPLRYVDPDGLKERTPWELLSPEERKIITPKIVVAKGQTVAQAFNAMATVKDANGHVDQQGTADKVTTIQNFIDSAGGHSNSAVWQQIQTINSIDLQSNESDPSKIEGRVTVGVANYSKFVDILARNGYWVDSDYEVFAEHPNNSARQETRTSFEPGLHLANDDSSNLNKFYAHWDRRSTAFRESSNQYWTSWGEMKDAADTHQNPYTPSQLRQELRKNGTVPRSKP